MASSGRVRGERIPLEHGELRITALDYKPVIRVVSDPGADLAAKFLERCHAVTLGS